MPQKTKVLMVDDDRMLLDMYKERLELAGYEVTGCANGEECLTKVHEMKPEIVLLDIMMPKVNGYDTLAAMKSDPQTKDIPVIILSALVRDINKSRALEAGADDYIIKSEVMPADVVKKIEAVLAKYQKDVTPEKSPKPTVSPKVTPKAPPSPQLAPPQEIEFAPLNPKPAAPKAVADFSKAGAARMVISGPQKISPWVFVILLVLTFVIFLAGFLYFRR